MQAWSQAIVGGVLLLAGCGLHRMRLWQVTRRLRSHFEMLANEQSRIAQHLYDMVIQDLAALSLQIEVLDEQLTQDPEAAKPTLDSLRLRMHRVLRDGRRDLTGLHDGLTGGDDLADALWRAAQELRGANGPSLHLVVHGRSRSLHPLVGDEVYRIARESMSNAFQHAGARHIEIVVSFVGDGLRVRILDDGRGMSDDLLAACVPTERGLHGMRKRATRIGAAFTIWSRVDLGTEIDLVIPAQRLSTAGQPTGVRAPTGRVVISRPRTTRH